MSKKNKTQQVTGSQKPVVTPQEITTETHEDFRNELLAAFEKEVAESKSRAKGMSLPMNEIIGCIDEIFDTVTIDKAPVKLMAEKVDKLLKDKYLRMSETATNEIAVRINPKTIQMVAEKDLRVLRLSQLKHMEESKTDNLYRRIYNIGSRAEYGRFVIRDSMIVRIKKIEDVLGDN